MVHPVQAMTLADRIGYCRLKLVDPATPPEDLAAWLAEHDGLMVGAGWPTPREGPAPDHTPTRVQDWFDRGRDDGQVLTALEAIDEAQKDTLNGQSTPTTNEKST